VIKLEVESSRLKHHIRELDLSERQLRQTVGFTRTETDQLRNHISELPLNKLVELQDFIVSKDPTFDMAELIGDTNIGVLSTLLPFASESGWGERHKVRILRFSTEADVARHFRHSGINLFSTPESASSLGLPSKIPDDEDLLPHYEIEFLEDDEYGKRIKELYESAPQWLATASHRTVQENHDLLEGVERSLQGNLELPDLSVGSNSLARLMARANKGVDFDTYFRLSNEAIKVFFAAIQRPITIKSGDDLTPEESIEEAGAMHWEYRFRWSPIFQTNFLIVADEETEFVMFKFRSEDYLHLGDRALDPEYFRRHGTLEAFPF